MWDLYQYLFQPRQGYHIKTVIRESARLLFRAGSENHLHPHLEELCIFSQCSSLSERTLQIQNPLPQTAQNRPRSTPLHLTEHFSAIFFSAIGSLELYSFSGMKQVFDPVPSVISRHVAIIYLISPPLSIHFVSLDRRARASFIIQKSSDGRLRRISRAAVGVCSNRTSETDTSYRSLNFD